MSLYNLMNGSDPFASMALFLIGIPREEFPRWRDATIADGKIRVLTRSGGPNRESYQLEIDLVKNHPLFAEEADDEYDTTYMHFVFNIPTESDLSDQQKQEIETEVKTWDLAKGAPGTEVSVFLKRVADELAIRPYKTLKEKFEESISQLKKNTQK
jgi:aspartyl-tRNA synthetase